MPSKDKRSLIQLGPNLVVTLPKTWTEFFEMKRGSKIPIMYDSILIALPEEDKQLENEVRDFLRNRSQKRR